MIVTKTATYVGTSYMGNCYYQIELNGVPVRTKKDSGVNFSITNFRQGDILEVKFSKAGQITSAKLA